MLYVVRHGKAGRKSSFSGDDRLRPLSSAGYRQAQALAETLNDAGVKWLISSPFLRCIETLQPTARAIGVAVTLDDRLADSRGVVAVVELIDTVPDSTALCSHGDVIPETIAALQRRGCEITSPPDWRKGSVWVLDRNASGKIITAEAWPPPDITS